MKNKKAARSKSQEQHVNIVPDISIIDLSNPSAEEDTAAQEPEPDEDEDSSGISMRNLHYNPFGIICRIDSGAGL